MKAVLVIEMPNEYADRYNVNEMYVWGLTVQDKHGYEMFDLVADKPNHLRPLPKRKTTPIVIKGNTGELAEAFQEGWNACLAEIEGETK